jgi:hypothetical protein
MNPAVFQEQDTMDNGAVRPPRPFRWWEGGKRAEYEKLMSHIVVLRERVRRLRAESKSNGQSTGVQRLVDEALQDRSWHAGGEEANRYADSLEELVPLIADGPYLTAVMDHELTRVNPMEGITLNTLFDSDDLQALRVACDTEASPQSERPLILYRVAQVLRLLVQKRAELLRHERLMDQLRNFYLPRLAITIAALLALTIFTILLGLSDGIHSMLHPWAELLAATWLGALGGALSGTLKLRDIAELTSFRTVAKYLGIQPLIGGVFGLVSWLILSSGLITVGSSDSWMTRAVVAFAVGYSEPLFVGILGRVMGLTTPGRGSSAGLTASASNRSGSAGTGPSPSGSINLSP